MITNENRKLLENLEEINFGDYRREVKADLMYGFLKQGDPAIWREEGDRGMGRKRHCMAWSAHAAML